MTVAPCSCHRRLFLLLLTLDKGWRRVGHKREGRGLLVSEPVPAGPNHSNARPANGLTTSSETDAV